MLRIVGCDKTNKSHRGMRYAPTNRKQNGATGGSRRGICTCRAFSGSEVVLSGFVNPMFWLRDQRAEVHGGQAHDKSYHLRRPNGL